MTGRFYYGWVIVGINLVVTLLVMGSTFSAFGLFVVPVSEEFGLSRANMNTALVIANIGNAILSPLVGRIADKIPARLTMLIGACAFGLNLVILGLSNSLILSALSLFILFPLAISAGAFITLNMLVARWFHHYKARALALSAIGNSLGGALVTPIVAILIPSIGWRTSLIVIGIAVTAIMLSLMLLIKEWPGPTDIEPSLPGVKPDTEEITADISSGPIALPELFRQVMFWKVAFAPSVASAIFTALSISLVPYAQDLGFDVTTTVSLVTLMGVGGVGTKLLLAAYGDRYDTALLIAILAALGLLSCVLMPFANNVALLFFCAILVGITWGGNAPIWQALLAESFGASSFGTVFGMSVFINATLTALAIRFAGEVYDRTGSYDLMFLVFAIASAGAAIMIFGLRKKDSRKYC